MKTKENLAYELSFTAVELIAASQRIDFDGLHHRYRRQNAAVRLLRFNAATNIRLARNVDRQTTQKVWRRHRKQIA